MITAKEAKNKTLESDKIKEILKEKQYEEICKDISNYIKIKVLRIISEMVEMVVII